MRSISFRTILIAAAVGFFALGVVTTVLRPRPPADRATPTSTRRPRSTEPVHGPPQLTILILGVDSLDADDPALLAVWLASFRPAGRELFLFGFPTDHELADGTRLQQAFASGEDPLESLESLASLSVLPLDAAIVLDSEGFAGLIDFLGGVPTGETSVDGAAALSVLALLRDDPAASLLAQARLLEAVSAQAPEVQPGTDLQPLLDLVPDHAASSMAAEQVLTLVAPYLPFESARIHVSLPATPAESPAQD